MLACGSTLLVLIITSSLKNTSLISASSSSDPPPLEGLAPAPDGVEWHRHTRHGEPNTKCSGGTAPCPSMLHLVLWWQNQLLVATTVAHSPSPSPPSTSPYLSCSSLQPSSEQGSLNTLWSPCASWLPKIAKMPTLHKIAVTHRATCKTGWWLWIKLLN